MKTQRILGLILFFSVMLTGLVNAQSLKVGYANPERIVDEHPDFAKIQSELQNLLQQRESVIALRRDSIATLFQQYQQTAPTLSQQQNEFELKKLEGLQAELQEMGNAARLEIQRKQSELLQPLYAKVQEAIDAVAEDMGLDFVFNRNTAMGDAIILFADEKSNLDITEKVIAKLINN